MVISMVVNLTFVDKDVDKKYKIDFASVRIKDYRTIKKYKAQRNVL